MYLTQATQVRHEQHVCNTSATRVRHERHECDTSVTECYTNDASTTRVKNFDFDNGTSKNIFSHPYIYYIASERLQGEEQFHSRNYLLEIPRFHAKMHLKSAPQKLTFFMTKAMSTRCTLDCTCKCPCTFPHSYAQERSLIFEKTTFYVKIETLFLARTIES